MPCPPRPSVASLGLEPLEGRALLSASTLVTAWVPNDASFADQWNLRNTGQKSGTVAADVNAARAWDVTTGSRRFSVAVMDSGIDYKHPDLYQNVWLNQKEIPASRRANLTDVDRDGLITFRDLNDARNQGVGKITDLNANGYIDGGDVLQRMTRDGAGNDSGRGGWADGLSQDGDRFVDDLIGWNFVNNTNNPFDDYGHGTHVAGTIGAMGNNNVGVAGVAWNVQLVPVKFFDNNGRGTIQQFIAGLDWALAKGIKVSNNSWVDASNSPELAAALTRAQNVGHVVVSAAGNGKRNLDPAPVYPAGFTNDNLVVVAATDRNDQLAGFSNYGVGSVDIAAPGVDVTSTTSWGRYGTRTGTSMATPQVTGAVALVWTLRPEWTYRQVISWVMATADRLPGLAGKVASGRLDLAAAVRVPPRGTPRAYNGVQTQALDAVYSAGVRNAAAGPTLTGLEGVAALLVAGKKDRPSSS